MPPESTNDLFFFKTNCLLFLFVKYLGASLLKFIEIYMSHFAYACKTEGEKRNLLLNSNTCRKV